MDQPIKMIEATCPNCQTEMEVELPDGLIYQDPNFDVEGWKKLHQLSEEETRYKYLLAELYSLRIDLSGSWRNKKAFKTLTEKIVKVESERNTVENERYELYNKLNPPVGERSTN